LLLVPKLLLGNRLLAKLCFASLIAERRACADRFTVARIGEAGASHDIAFPSGSLGTRGKVV